MNFIILESAIPMPVSAVNHAWTWGYAGWRLLHYFPEAGQRMRKRTKESRVAIVGKPNVGKSSLINKLLGENRLIVSDIAGTTRDAVDTDM